MFEGVGEGALELLGLSGVDPLDVGGGEEVVEGPLGERGRVVGSEEVDGGVVGVGDGAVHHHERGVGVAVDEALPALLRLLAGLLGGEAAEVVAEDVAED